MEVFKLIAIEPLQGCEPHILKNLTIGEKYYFYKGYDIKDDNTIEVDKEIVLSSDFFTNGIPKISVHAIVGKNGSGKSAIIELMLRAINNLSSVFFGVDKGAVDVWGVKAVLGVCVKLYYQIDSHIYCFTTNDTEVKIESPEDVNKYVRKNDTHWCKIECTISKWQINNSGKSTLIETELSVNKDNTAILKQFFYTNLINYSHYSYNTKEHFEEFIDNSSTPYPEKYSPLQNNPTVCWYDGLFHKNDGYETPVVINPMRKKGLIDINNETHLSIGRLLGLIVRIDTSDIRTFNDKNEICALKLSLRSNSYWETLEKNWGKRPQLFRKISMYIIDEWQKQANLKCVCVPKDFPELKENYKFQYLIYKTISANNTYQDIIKTEMYISPSFKGTIKEYRKTIKKLVSWLYNDPSHITYKIKQTLNYIEKTIDLYERYIDSELPIGDFIPGMKKLSERTQLDDLFLMAPPAFLNTEILFKDKTRSESPTYSITKLSTGERHFIYSFSTIMYQLKNLDSVSRDGSRIYYNNVSVLLEENDLYSHPEMQRIQITQMIEYIKGLKLENIKGVNIGIVTHSPIVLSDIPKQNILFLDYGLPKVVQELTFGANIHSLYKHSFFMNLPMGEFAKKKIEMLFDELRSSTDFSKAQLSDIKTEIQLIGEPLLRNQLMKLYHEKCNIEEKISDMEKELAKLREQQSNDKN